MADVAHPLVGDRLQESVIRGVEWHKTARDSRRWREALEGEVEGRRDRLREAKLALEIRVPPDIGTFIGDEKRVVQVLYNLLANAVGYSLENAYRALRRRTLDMMVLVAVAVGAGWLYSVGVTLTGGGDVFYEAAAMLTAGYEPNDRRERAPVTGDVNCIRH